ncbi:hypothetical protein ACFQRB_00030 [Halobaculum litoreum]|uniref:Uncharacterized protein n=1 Tax=Halobaculum litoreum TaxID=3031998 RepID=A0ABD5XKD3_9EURY
MRSVSLVVVSFVSVPFSVPSSTSSKPPSTNVSEPLSTAYVNVPATSPSFTVTVTSSEAFTANVTLPSASVTPTPSPSTPTGAPETAVPFSVTVNVTVPLSYVATAS